MNYPSNALCQLGSNSNEPTYLCTPSWPCTIPNLCPFESLKNQEATAKNSWEVSHEPKTKAEPHAFRAFASTS